MVNKNLLAKNMLERRTGSLLLECEGAGCTLGASVGSRLGNNVEVDMEERWTVSLTATVSTDTQYPLNRRKASTSSG